MTNAGLSASRLRLTLSLDYLVSYLGRFSLMPVLAMLLANQGGEASWAMTGLGLFGFTLFAGMSSLVVNRWLPAIPYLVSLPASMVCSAVGFGLLPYTRDPAVTMLLLLAAGFGISMHAVLSRVLIAEVIPSAAGRNTIYSIQQVCTNIAAAVGPFIAAALYVSGDGRPLLGLVGVAYLLAAVSLVAGLRAGQRPPASAHPRTWGVVEVLRLLRDEECRRASVITAMGTFVYAQFYSAFALLVALAVGGTLTRGALLAAPAVAIVLLQPLVTAAANRHLRAGVAPPRILALAVLVFGAAMLVLGAGLPVVAGAAAAMAVFALAEMLFTPMVSTTFNGLAGASALASSNLQQLAWTAGEALGSLCGGAVFLAFYHNGAAGMYWLLLAAVAIAGTAPYLAARRRIPERTVA